VPQGAGHPIGRLPRDLRRNIAIGVHRVTEIMEPDRWQAMPWRPACRTPGKTPTGGRSTCSTARSW